MDGSQRGPFLGPRTPLASAGRGPPSGSRGPTQSWKDGFRESLGANTPQSILVHPVLRSPPQGLPDDLQPLALPSGFPNPTGLRVRADGDLRTVGLQMPGSDPLPSQRPAPCGVGAALASDLAGMWSPRAQYIRTLPGQCPVPTRLHMPRVRTPVLGGPAAPAPRVNPDKPVLALLSPGIRPLCPLPGHTALRSAPAWPLLLREEARFTRPRGVGQFRR